MYVCGWGGEGIGGSLLFRNLHHTGQVSLPSRTGSWAAGFLWRAYFPPRLSFKRQKVGQHKTQLHEQKNLANIVRMKITTGKVTWLRKSRG